MMQPFQPGSAVPSQAAVASTDPAPALAWYQQPTQAVLSALGSTTRGLSDEEAARRRAEVGPNELIDRGSKHPLRILWEQLTAVMVLILVGAALLSLVLGAVFLKKA
jgi:P-type Ca2+ transporter type 2C